MQNRSDKARLADEIKNKKYIDGYIEKWLKLDNLDMPYVECEICGYASNASIHQHLLVPKEFCLDSGNNQIIHLCANCNYELRALIDKYRMGMEPEKIFQTCMDAFEKLKDMKKNYKDINKNAKRIEV